MGCLAQGMPGRVKSTNRMFFMTKKDIPFNNLENREE